MKVTIKFKNDDLPVSGYYENVSRAYLTEYETFYMLTLKNKTQVCIATYSILQVEETPEEGDDDIF